MCGLYKIYIIKFWRIKFQLIFAHFLAHLHIQNKVLCILEDRSTYSFFSPKRGNINILPRLSMPSILFEIQRTIDREGTIFLSSMQCHRKNIMQFSKMCKKSRRFSRWEYYTIIRGTS